MIRERLPFTAHDLYPSNRVIMMRSTLIVAAFCAAAGCSTASSTDATPTGLLADVVRPGDDIATGRLDRVTGIRVWRDATGRVSGMSASDDVLVADDVSREPADRAKRFLGDYGSVIGLTRDERQALPLRELDVSHDASNITHVRLDQLHDGMPVLGGQLIVHVTDAGIVGVNGTWVAGLKIPASPSISRLDAAGIAHGAALKQAQPASLMSLRVGGAELAVLRDGILDPRKARRDHLAWRVQIDGDERFQVWVDATTGELLETLPLNHHARNRIAYLQSYSDDVAGQPGPTAVCFENQMNGGLACQGAPRDLFRFSGQVYDMFFAGFARDSYNGAGITMRTVNLVSNACPNAYWDGTSTNYCPGFELDDVVAHEWGHAYTQFTHNLIYAYQSGALNESYSDIWGEVIDLNNGEDGVGGGGAMNAEPAPTGVRWAVGEDFGTGSGEYELLLRDMWDPDRLLYPGKVTSKNYECGSGDGGGVHSNSGVPNHAFALLVDGTDHPATCTTSPNNCRAPLTCNPTTNKCESNGQSITALGSVKASHIYYAASLLQGPTTNFPQHADALEMACTMLTSTTPRKGFLGLAAEAITAADCAQVGKAMLAVEMRTPPNCGFEPMLQPNPPPACRGATPVMTENWSDGLAGWTRANAGTPALEAAPNDKYNWTTATTKPANKPGSAAFAPNFKEGTCAGDGDYSGLYTLDSPTLTAPASGTGVELRFEHFVETELNYDGGQLLISVNNGAFTLVPENAYRHNAPNRNFEAPPPVGLNTNPNAGERAWTGADGGASTGSWGTTVVNLASLVTAGQTYKLRFEFSIDGCNGVTGWYLGDLVVHHCPPLPGPTLSVTNYENAPNGPDTDGAYNLNWTRPTGGGPPDTLQESTVSCAPALVENCEAGFSKWTRASEGAASWGTGTKPAHATNTFRVVGVENAVDESTTLTTLANITVPTGSTTTLTWEEWFVNESDDRGFVEVTTSTACTTPGPNEAQCGLNAKGDANLCDASVCWTEIYSVDRALLAGEADAAFAIEDLAPRRASLDQFAGTSIKLRFRYYLGPNNRAGSKPTGWYLDNIRVDVDKWTTIANGNITTRAITGKADAAYCYRATTTHTINSVAIESDFSNIVNVVVDRAVNLPDQDMDTVVDASDNCVTTANTDQADADGDSIGDACDPCFGTPNLDVDTDGRCNTSDNCPAIANPTQTDTDNDGLGDACDCAVGEDSDSDLVCNNGDNCPMVSNPDQADADGDTVGNACDPCTGASNLDGDADRVCNEVDNCPTVANPTQADADADMVGDACDCVAANDQDGDGACNATDNCPMVANADQQDTDADGVGDACDPCAGASNVDGDGDKVCDADDNCPAVANPDQADADSNGTGDACADGCADADDDGICDTEDNCPDIANPDQRVCFADDGGCGCQSQQGGAAGVLPWLVVGFVLLRRRHKARTAALGTLAIVLLAIAPPAQADSPRKLGVQLGGFVVGFVADDDHEFYDYMSSTQVPIGAVAPGFGLRAALFPLPFLGIEAEGEWMRSSTDDRGSVNLFGFGGHLIVQKPGKLRPFALGGLGAMALRSKDATLGNDLDAIGYAGLGVAYDITRRLALRGDGRWLRGPAANVQTGTQHFLFGVGVSGLFDIGGGDAPARLPDPIEAPPPAPVDGDGDGLLGAADSCPDQAETMNGWEDSDGCPDTIPDTDADGLNDLVDRCRDVPEDVDAFQDDDGCADPDNDGDGAADGADKCPIVSGPLANQGCPDSDRDSDTVVDRLDNCPDEAGTVANHGCKAKQLVTITPTQLQILDTVYFQTNSAKLLPRSNKLLDNVARVLRAHPEIGNIRIEGHTDDRGDDAYNLKLSQQRAESVRAYLAKKQVPVERLDAKGFGKGAPLDPLRTPDARAANRRVEFHIVPPF